MRWCISAAHGADYKMSATWSILALVTGERRKGTNSRLPREISL